MKKLKKIAIGSGVASIGKNAFSNLKNGCVITIKSKNLKKVASSINLGTKNLVIKVPKSKLKAYTKLFKKSKGVKVVAK